MSNTFKCTECGGSGIMMGDHGEYLCPECTDGNMVLAVAVPAKHEGDTGYYRPLTTDEVEAMIAGIKHFHPSMEASIKSLLWLINNTGGLTYKGQPVKLIPGDK